MATGSGKTGKPSISDIRNLDVRSISMAVSNIRQRIEAIEGALGVTTDTAQEAATTSGLQLKELLNEISALDSRVTILEKTASTDIVAYTAGETIASGQGVVGISASTIGVADPSDPTRMFGLIGIATNGGSVGASILVQRRGVFTIPGASGFFVGRAAYLDNSGYVTQTPDYEATALPIGVAVSSSQIFINPDYPSILQQTFSSGFSDAFEKYLPITLGGLLPLLTEIDPVCIQAACSDETTSLTTGIKLVFRVPYNFTLTNVRASLTTAQTSGSIFTCNVKMNGISVLGTPVTIDNGEKTSVTAVTTPVITTTAMIDDDEIVLTIDQVGDGTAKGLKMTLIGTNP